MATLKFLKQLQSQLQDFFEQMEEEMHEDANTNKQPRGSQVRRVKEIKKVKVDLKKPTKDYRNEQRKLLRQKNPEMKPQDVLKLIEKNWLQLSKQQRMKYAQSENPTKPQTEQKRTVPVPAKKQTKDKNTGKADKPSTSNNEA